MSRAAAAAAVEKIVHKACEESRRLNETQVFVFKIQVDTATFEGSELAKTRGLRFALSLAKEHESSSPDRLIQTPSIKPLLEEGEGRQRCFFKIRHEVDVLWEGDDKFILTAIQPGLFFSSSLGSCELPLSVCYEQLVSTVKSCNPTEADALPIELEFAGAKAGRCCLFVSCWKDSLGTLGGRKALRSTVPEVSDDGQMIHSDVIKHKMQEIHECHSLNNKLSKAQANLWMQGVQRLTEEGALDSKTLSLAQTCGLVSVEKAELLRQTKNAQPKLYARSGSFHSVERGGGSTWLRFTTA